MKFKIRCDKHNADVKPFDSPVILVIDNKHTKALEYDFEPETNVYTLDLENFWCDNDTHDHIPCYDFWILAARRVMYSRI